MIEKNLNLMEGQAGRLTFDIVAPEGTEAILQGAVRVRCMDYIMQPEPGDPHILYIGAMAPGSYLYEVRCNGETVLYGYVEVKASPLGDIHAIKDWRVSHDFSQTIARTEIHLAPGPRGPRGEKGDPGKGEKGDPGKSAFEAAVEAGYTGTEAEWLGGLRDIDHAKDEAARSASAASAHEAASKANSEAAAEKAAEAERHLRATETQAEEAAASATAAAGFKAEAQVSAEGAETSNVSAGKHAEASAASATASEGSAQRAATSEGNAATSASNAAASETHAGEQAQASENSATRSEESATRSDGSATSAEKSATRADERATAARESATASEQSAKASEQSATKSKEEAGKAASSAETASTKAGEAQASATAAKASETAAAGSAETAGQHASTASTKANEAGDEAGKAKTSADAATDKAAEASASADDAKASEDAAAVSAEEAKAARDEFVGHLTDDERHLTAGERRLLRDSVPDWDAASSVPEGALTHAAIRAYFARNAQPGTDSVPAASSAPSAVYLSRLPHARLEGEAWVNNSAAVNESVFGFPRKMMDNAGLVHECSTDTTEGRDDYENLWAFHWEHGNYIVDEWGVKHLTAIKGQRINGVEFDPNKPVCSFGTPYWHVCKLEHSQNEEGVWRTSDGTKDGVPLCQIWVHSPRAWADLDSARRAELASYGVTEEDFSLCSECYQYDPAKGEMVPRPYWIHSAYCGGAELQENGAYKMVSKRNLPLFNQLSHNSINNLYGWQPGFGGSASVQGYGVHFDVIKNASKNSQSFHSGMSSNAQNAVLAAHSTLEADYLFPIAAKGAFEAGCTVMLWQSNANYGSATYKRSKAVQVGRIAAIETRSLTLADGTQTESLCLVIDPETVQPFIVRTGTSEEAATKGEEAIAATKELTDAGIYACCYVTQGMALTGETDAVIGKHDGSRTSNTNGKHPYRVQGTEYMPGIWLCAADTVAIKGTGAIAVTIDGIESTPTSSEYVILQAGIGIKRRSSGTLQQFLDSGYKPVGIATTTQGWILNVQMSRSGVVFPTAAGGTGSGSGNGHCDYLYTGASPAEFLCGGHLDNGAVAGSVCLYLYDGLGTGYWLVGGRD